jgi:hypothetical protein
VSPDVGVRSVRAGHAGEVPRFLIRPPETGGCRCVASSSDSAERAGSAPGYIQYVEERQATPGIGFLLRLAQALETTVAELTGSTTELPPGIGRAGYHTELLELRPQECRQLLSTHGVGRIGVTTNDGPAILPVN